MKFNRPAGTPEGELPPPTPNDEDTYNLSTIDQALKKIPFFGQFKRSFRHEMYKNIYDYRIYGWD